jgi:meiotically up-regulated gene 157 (Mug157) protein
MATLPLSFFFTQVQSFILDPSGQPDSFIITGDISAMWLRDSANQISPYIPFVLLDARLDELVYVISVPFLHTR